MNNDGIRTDARAHPIDADAQPSTIEAQIDAKRADIDRTLGQLESRFNPERLIDYVRENGGEITGNLGRTFKQNPVPFIITGVGLAWLMSAQQTANRDPYYPRYRSSRYDGDPHYEEDVSGLRRSSSQPAFGNAYTSSVNHDDDDSDGRSMADRMKDRASSLSGQAGQRADAMGRRVSGAGENARDKLERLRARAEARYQRMNSETRQRYDGMSSSARLHYDRLSDDAADQYDSLAADARQKYDQARRKAERAGRELRSQAVQLRGQAGQAGERSADFLREQPLVAAALGASIGALIGSLLPPSRTEDRYLGAQADRYRDEAREMAGKQMDSLGERARGTMEKVRDDAEQALKTAGDKAEQAVAQADRKAGNEGAKAADKTGLPGSGA